MLATPSDEIQRARLLQKESPSDVQLHLAAIQGDMQLLRRILDSGKVHVDSKDTVRTYWVARRCTWTVRTGREQVSDYSRMIRLLQYATYTCKTLRRAGPFLPGLEPIYESQMCFCTTVRGILV
jgi:hypothetical protein